MTAETPKRPGIFDEIQAEIEASKVEEVLDGEEKAKREALAAGLFELIGNQDLLNLILRRDKLARSRVEIVLCQGGRDDIETMEVGEELILRVVRQRGSRGHLGEIIARQWLGSASFLFGIAPRLPKGIEQVVEGKAKAFFGAEYGTIRAEEWRTGGNYEITLERSVRSVEELLRTHGSRLEEIMETLKISVERPRVYVKEESGQDS